MITLEPPVVRARQATLAVTLAVALVGCNGDDGPTTTSTADAGGGATTDGAGVTLTNATQDTTVDVVDSAPAGFTFTPPEGDYSVRFPAEPTPSSQTEPLPDGTAVPVTFYVVGDGAVAYGSARTVYPPGTVVSLEGSRDGALADIGATLTSSEPIVLQGRPGLQFTARVQAGPSTYLSRVYADDVRLYQLVTIVSGEAGFDDPAVATFFESFRFTEDR